MSAAPPAALADPMLPAPWRVRAVRRETADVVTLDLVPLASGVPCFAPGQFNMIYAYGVGEVPVSLSGDPADRSCFVHTVRAVGAVSAAIAGAAPGSVLGLRGPFGSAWPVDAAAGHDLLIVAGGLGLAPLRPAIYRVLARSERFGRIAVLYGGRGPAELLFRDELAVWGARADVTVAVTVDHADPSWHGHVGVVPALIGQIGFDPPNTVALLCGPEVMLRFTATALRAAGVAAERIHLSMERNMKCAIGLCGHCQFGPDFVCQDGPVLRYDRIAARLAVREI
ncbi:FAD/NAD(P)-binding protein [Acidiphilium sp.]|uniref:FAD/NAD(P)-binding protein n=1 Tax=Acidiphilium sp. TaxID=527 RepID=UPI0025877231|nr:FAD/NAD(P)-binding protein [Acidiphilium sp.]